MQNKSGMKSPKMNQPTQKPKAPQGSIKPGSMPDAGDKGAGPGQPRR